MTAQITHPRPTARSPTRGAEAGTERTLYSEATPFIPSTFLNCAQLLKSSLHFFLTSGCDVFPVPHTLSLSSRASSQKHRWKRDPAFWIRPSRMARARSWRWTLPYFSFLRMARAASAGPEAWMVIISTSSGMPERSSSSWDSEVRLSMETVTAV